MYFLITSIVQTSWNFLAAHLLYFRNIYVFTYILFCTHILFSTYYSWSSQCNRRPRCKHQGRVCQTKTRFQPAGRQHIQGATGVTLQFRNYKWRVCRKTYLKYNHGAKSFATFGHSSADVGWVDEVSAVACSALRVGDNENFGLLQDLHNIRWY